MELIAGLTIHILAFILTFYIGRKTGYEDGYVKGKRKGLAERLTIANSLLDGTEGFWFK